MNANQDNIEEFEAAAEIEVDTVTEGSVAELVRSIVGSMRPETWTAYQIHNVVNKALEALGTDYRVRPQMMYNYDSNGMVVRGVKAKRDFTVDEVIAFATRFVGKRTAK